MFYLHIYWKLLLEIPTISSVVSVTGCYDLSMLHSFTAWCFNCDWTQLLIWELILPLAPLCLASVDESLALNNYVACFRNCLGCSRSMLSINCSDLKVIVSVAGMINISWKERNWVIEKLILILWTQTAKETIWNTGRNYIQKAENRSRHLPSFTNELWKQFVLN